MSSLIERAVARLGETASDNPETVDATRDGAAPAAKSTPQRPPATPPVPAATPAETLHIDLESLRAAGVVTPSGDQTPTFAQFRVIKRPLINNAFGRAGNKPLPNGKRVMVTSAFPGEGKTFCAANLAMSIAAERDHKIILIDADVARPAVPRMLGIQHGEGLMEWLAADSPPPVGQIVLPTNIESLSVIRAGHRHDRRGRAGRRGDPRLRRPRSGRPRRAGRRPAAPR